MSKLSRKGATAQSRFRGHSSFLAPLCLCGIVITIVVSLPAATAQQLSVDYSFNDTYFRLTNYVREGEVSQGLQPVRTLLETPHSGSERERPQTKLRKKFRRSETKGAGNVAHFISVFEHEQLISIDHGSRK